MVNHYIGSVTSIIFVTFDKGHHSGILCNFSLLKEGGKLGVKFEFSHHFDLPLTLPICIHRLLVFTSKRVNYYCKKSTGSLICVFGVIALNTWVPTGFVKICHIGFLVFMFSPSVFTDYCL